MLVMFVANVNAQDDNNPWQITVGVNAVDVYPVGEDSPQGELFDEFYNVEGHWNLFLLYLQFLFLNTLRTTFLLVFPGLLTSLKNGDLIMYK